MKLLPRISREDVWRVAEALEEAAATAENAREVVDSLGIAPRWNRSGGEVPPDRAFDDLAENLRQEARNSGYPEDPGEDGRRRFDRAACRILHESMLLRDAGGETLRDDCWAGLTCLHFPDLVIWRFRKPAAGRLGGGVRNLLQRLWLRVERFRLPDAVASPWLLVDNLTEDAFVQLLERPSLSAVPDVARGIGLIWMEHARGGGNVEALMRHVTRNLRARNEVRLLAALEPHELNRLIRSAFAEGEHYLEQSENDS